MSEKKVGKRLLTWVLVLVMTLSLLPLNVLAAEVSEKPDVVQGYYDENSVWTEGTDDSVILPKGVDSVSKTAVPTGKSNEYTVTLEVKMHTTTTTQTSYAQAATVLVIDTSSSMSYCLLPEHEHTDNCYISTGVACDGTHLSTEKVYHHIIGSGICIYNESDKTYYKATPGCGLTEHTHSSPGYFDSGCGASGNNRLATAKAAAINFLDSYRAGGTGRYVALVDFNTNATVADADWQDVSTKAGYNAILDAIKNLSADGGTNLDDGLQKANQLFTETDVQGIGSKNIIALTDGKPTYYMTTNLLGNPSVGGNGKACSPEVFKATANTATSICNGGTTLYSICFGAANEEVTNPYTNTNITLFDYLNTYIAPDKTYSAGDLTELKNAFAAISTNITSGLSSGTVHDSLPTGVTSDAIPSGTVGVNWELKDFEKGENTEGPEGNTTTYYTYTKTYTVKIDPTAVDAEQYGGYYPLNGPTTLTVKDSNQNDVTINFPIPAGKVTLPEPEYTLTFDANGGSWTGLSDDSAYTLNESKDKATQKVAANSKPAVVSPIPVKSGFTFDGWYLENDRLYVDFVPVGNSDMTLVAHWKPTTTKTYTVIYTDGLTANKAFDDRAFPNLSVDADTPDFGSTPTRSGYVFTGWTPTVAPRVEAPKDGSTVITYTATWEVDNWNRNDNRETGGDGIPDKYQALVKFLPGDPNGKVSGRITQVITMPKTGVEYVSEVKLGSVEGFEVATTTPKIDFEFNVWTMNKVTDENEDEAKTAVTPKDVTVKAGSKTTFFAHFKSIPATYTVTYTDGVDGEEIFADKVNRDLHYNDPTPNFGSDPTRDGYTFAGWEPVVADKVTGNATYTAKWEAKSYTVTYNSNGGTVVKPETVTYGNKATKPTNPTRSGYTFAGWYTDNEKFFNKYDFNTLVTGNIILYAKWNTNYVPYYPPVPPTVKIEDDDALGLNTTDHFAYIIGYGNGEVRPQNNITRAEVATIFFRLLTDDVRDENLTKINRYSDVAATSWYNTAVSTLSSMGIITGYPDGTFRPNAAITRAEFAAIAARFDNDGDKTAAKFSDIATHWAKDEISIAYNNGWITGYPNGTFGPQRDITRAETMTLVNRVLNRQPETEDDLLPNMTVWTDNANPNAWYYLAVQEATNSHYYKFKTNSKYEKWTELRETRDWTQLEK